MSANICVSSRILWLYLPNAPYVLTMRSGSKDVFITCLELSRFVTTGMLRQPIRMPKDMLTTRRINIPDTDTQTNNF